MKILASHHTSLHIQETIRTPTHERHDGKHDQHIEKMINDLNVLISACALSTIINEGHQCAMSLVTLTTRKTVKYD